MKKRTGHSSWVLACVIDVAMETSIPQPHRDQRFIYLAFCFHMLALKLCTTIHILPWDV